MAVAIAVRNVSGRRRWSKMSCGFSPISLRWADSVRCQALPPARLYAPRWVPICVRTESLNPQLAASAPDDLQLQRSHRKGGERFPERRALVGSIVAEDQVPPDEPTAYALAKPENREEAVV
jgi:hypothetical protein